MQMQRILGIYFVTFYFSIGFNEYHHINQHSSFSKTPERIEPSSDIDTLKVIPMRC